MDPYPSMGEAVAAAMQSNIKNAADFKRRSAMDAERITHLRAELERHKSGADASDANEEARYYWLALERVRAAARKAKDSGNIYDLYDVVDAALEGESE